MKYLEYLETKHWQSVRLFALERAENKCQLCGDKNNLNVHHNTYKRLEGERPADVIVLCRKCHERHHNFMRVFESSGRPRIKIKPQTKIDKEIYNNNLRLEATTDEKEIIRLLKANDKLAKERIKKMKEYKK